MKTLRSLLIVWVALLFLLTPLLAWLASLVYASIDWLGHLFVTDKISDGRAAFRAGVMLGGSISVLSFMRVAWLDKSDYYSIAVGMLSLLFFFLTLLTGIGADSDQRPQASRDDASATMDNSPRNASRWQTPSRWQTREAFEQDMRKKLHETMRTAARGNMRRTDVLLDELRVSSRNWPRRTEDSTRFENLRAKYDPLAQKQEALLPDRAQTWARRLAMNSEEYQRMEAESIELLRQMWAASPEQPGIGMLLLVKDLRSLVVSGGFWPRRRAVSGEALESLRQRLRQIHAQQEQLLVYAPLEESLWETYGKTLVDQDEELALGAQVIAGRIEERRSSGDYGYGLNSYPMLSSNLKIVSSLLLGNKENNSQARADILEARAKQLLAPPSGNVLLSENLSEKAPVILSQESAALAEQAMPPAGRLEDGTGLWMPPPEPLPAPPKPTPETDFGQITVDLAAAGFKPQPSGIVFRESGIIVNSRVVLALDVWKDGRVTSVLVEESSGLPGLDQAARLGAAGWRSARKVPESGERRRVTIEFTAPPRRLPFSLTPVPQGGDGL
ncbi:MAG: energy transducer TonB [Azonexus sp.]|jgi:TonB family protein|nr:energy transducer TonB [Azonexus sp.]